MVSERPTRAVVLSITATILNFLYGFLTVFFTIHFASFPAILLFNALPPLVSGVGMVAGSRMLYSGVPGSTRTGGFLVLIFGLVPINVVYDILHTISAYGSEYMTFSVAIAYLLFVTVSMSLAIMGGVLGMTWKPKGKVER